jgi:hypothetical protein
VNVDNDSGTRINGELVTASGGVTLVLQAADRFALTFGGGASVPVIEFEELGVPTVWSGSAGILLAADSWDVVLRGAFATSSATLVELGLKKRWGL